MPRPRNRRRISSKPGVTYFKPAGVRMMDLEEITLNIDEWEAVRLTDFLELEQIESSKKMGISQPTFHRLLKSARKKLTEAIIEGKAIRVEGGEF
ncbi:MAG: hypothetical protein DRP06_00605 [Candidatus Aenigmatarchaeota archaeon]|nr:MAG: hypothetical protein DRP06_00605 [Candidatus Aenigmarchaeota archaeon]